MRHVLPLQSPACSPPNPAIVLAFVLIYVVITIAGLAGQHGWRRLSGPWRTASFVVFVVCSLFLLDTFAYALAVTLTSPAPVC